MDIISKSMTINEIIQKDRGAIDILLKHGLNCLGCPASELETLQEASNAHNADIDKILKELNEFFENKFV